MNIFFIISALNSNFFKFYKISIKNDGEISRVSQGLDFFIYLKNVGRIDERKGLVVLLNAFASLKYEIPEARLLIVGGKTH